MTENNYNREGIVGLNEWAEARIAAGDLDFDDIVYKTRSTTKTILNGFAKLDKLGWDHKPDKVPFLKRVKNVFRPD